MKIFVTVFVCLCFFLSCSPRVNIAVNADNSATVSFQTDIGVSVKKALENSGFFTESATIFDEKQIRSSFLKTNLTVTKLTFPSQTAIDLSVKSLDVRNILPNNADFIVISQNGAQNILRIRISPQNCRQVIAFMPSDTADFLDLLMAPLLTGEKMTESEYVDLIGITYGQNLAQEIKKSNITFTITVPLPIKSVTITPSNSMILISRKERTATFTVPFSLFLTDTTIHDYTIEW